MKKLMLLSFLFLSVNVFSQREADEVKSPVNWMTINKADSLFSLHPKPMLIDVYTDWCGWCKVMMKNTFSNPTIAGYINRNFYPVRINAEKDDTLKFNGKLWIKQQGQKVNPLARFLLNNRLAYPTIVYIDYKKRHYPIPGYYDVKKIQPILVYFAENLTDFIDLQKFINYYYFTYPHYYKTEIEKTPQSEKPDTSGQINWIPIQKAIDTTADKLYFVFGYVNWCSSCKVMKDVVFRNKIIADYINKNFIPVAFDLASEQTIILNGKKFVSLGKGQPNQLTFYMLDNKATFPVIIFLNQKFQPLTYIQGFLEPSVLEKILNYFGSNSWQSMSYEDFAKNFQGKIK